MTLVRPLRASSLSTIFVYIVVAFLAIAPVAAACGNGVVETGEDCDDGSSQNGGANSCCTTGCTFSGETPDVIVGDLTAPQRYGTVGGITAYAVGTVSCNLGSCWLNWISGTAEHPVISQNMFRLKDGRFEQIGQSWLKHGFTALTQNVCASCIAPPSGAHLGVNCSDPYVASLNGDQTNLGPKNDVNPNTGVYLWPDARISNTAGVNSTIGKRLQVHNTDLAFGGGSPTALYFVEGQYVTHDDATAKNNANNASYRPVSVGASPNFSLTLTGSTQRQRAGIKAWKDSDPTVTEVDVAAPEGLFILSAKATSLGGGIYHYEYAVQNLTNQRAGQSFSVPIPPGAVITNPGFHDVDYHTNANTPSDPIYDGTDWPVTIGSTTVSWATTPFATNANANALRWGTLYNFRFDANVAPGTGTVTIGLFRPGTPTTATATTVTPGSCAGAPDGTACNDSNPCTLTDVCSSGVCAGTNPVICSPMDQCHNAGTCDSGTGVCSNPLKANGAACNDANLCTQTDTCQGGACAGSSPVVCTASDQCHDVGVCAPATGACSNPNKQNGVACVDADLCTQGDTCQAGACQSGSPVVCTAINSCHLAGVCNPGTGACSNPNAPDGTGCSDGNACTQTDLCSAGICGGSNPILCTPLDACHQAGTCAPGTGICSNPNGPNGTPCNDGNICTENDGCQSGACQGGTPVTCVASDTCHLAGTCTPGIGCSNPAKADGSGCNDSNSCTENDVCTGGACAGTGVPSPAEVDSVSLSESGPVTTINWNMAFGATSSSVLRGNVSALPVGPGGGDEICLDAGIAGTSTTDSQVPGEGEVYWYLIQGVNVCGKGSYGSAQIAGSPVTRSSTTCP